MSGSRACAQAERVALRQPAPKALPVRAAGRGRISLLTTQPTRRVRKSITTDPAARVARTNGTSGHANTEADASWSSDASAAARGRAGSR